MAGDQSRLPLRAARPCARRVRVVCRQSRILAAAVGARLQSHGRGADAAKPPRRTVLATARTPAGPVRRQRHHSCRLGCAVLMELGPQPILTAAAMRAWPDTAPTPQTIASLRRDTDAHRCLTEALAAAYASGHRLDFAGRSPRPRRSVDLPTYPFQHRTYWFPAYTAPELNSRARAGTSWSGEAAQPRSRVAARRPASHWCSAYRPSRGWTAITELIVAELADALRIPAAEIDPGAEFMSLGMDSLTAMDLRRRLQAALGTEVPASLFFAHPTVAALAEGLLAVWLDDSPGQAKRQVAIPRHGPGRRTAPVARSGAVVVPAPASAVVECVQRGRSGRHPRSRGSRSAARSLDAVVARHEVLRTTFRSVQGVPQAVLVAPQPFELPFERVGTEADVAAAAAREAAVPFDIGVGPLLRARLLGLGEQRHVLVLTMHHIVTDGWSFRVLLRDLGLVYQALEGGKAAPLAELPIQYSDYAQWQREQLRGASFDTHLEYWRKNLADASPLELDTDRPRPKTPTFRGARTHFELGRDCATAAARSVPHRERHAVGTVGRGIRHGAGPLFGAGRRRDRHADRQPPQDRNRGSDRAVRQRASGPDPTRRRSRWRGAAHSYSAANGRGVDAPGRAVRSDRQRDRPGPRRQPQSAI